MSTEVTSSGEQGGGYGHSTIAGLITRWVLFVSCHARPVMVLLAVTTAIAAFWAVQLFSLNSDTSQLIKPSDETRWHQRDLELKAAFPQFQNTAVVVISGRNLADVNNTSDVLFSAFAQSDWFHSVSAPGREEFFTEHLLYELSVEDLTRLSQEMQALLPMLYALDRAPGLATFFTLVQQSLMRDRSAGALSTGSSLLLQKLLEGLMGNEPVSWIFNEDGELGRDVYQIIFLQGRQQFDESTPAKAVMEEVRRIIGEHQPAGATTRVRVTGELAMADEELRTALAGIQFAGMASFVLLGFLLTFGVRSWTIVLAIFTLLIAGVIWTCLYASLAVGSFNTLSLVFLVMFFGLGVDFAIHFCLRVQESLSLPGEREHPLASATRDIGTALLLCTVTSGLAFLSFFPTEYRGLADLGIISAGGIVIAFVLTMTLLPAWFALFGMPAPRQGTPSSALHFGMDQFKPTTVLVLTLVVSAAAAWIARDVRFDYSVLAMRDSSSEAMETLLEMQAEQLSTDYSVSILVPPDELDALVQQLSRLPTVARVETPKTRIASMQSQKQALLAPLHPYGNLQLIMPESFDDLATSEAQRLLMSQLASAVEYATGENLELLSAVSAALQNLRGASEREKLEENLLVPLFEGVLSLRSQVVAQPYTVDDLPAIARARLVAPDGRYLVEVLPVEQLNDPEAMDRFVADVGRVAPNIAGQTVVEHGVGKLVVKAFQQAVGFALVGITIVLLLYFREILTPVLVLIPLGLTTLFTFAVIELSGLTLNMANILVVPLIFGLGVDTGIHVVHRYHVAGNVSELLRSSTPRAVTLSALTTIGTFISLSFNPHKGAASIGLILSVAISLLMLVTFIVLPALLARFEPKSARKKNRNIGVQE